MADESIQEIVHQSHVLIGQVDVLVNQLNDLSSQLLQLLEGEGDDGSDTSGS